MSRTTWAPSWWGKTFTSAPSWRLELLEPDVVLHVDEQSARMNVMVSEGWTISRGFIWSRLNAILPGGAALGLDGLSAEAANALHHALGQARAAYRQHLEVRKLLGAFPAAIQPVVEWAQQLIAAAKAQLSNKGWLTSEFVARWVGARPTSVLTELLTVPEVKTHLAAQPEAIRNGVGLWQQPLEKFAAGVNDRHLARELEACKDFFDRVEKTPLTEEQSRAVVCFDNRVQVIASAGSGKTSTMVAKAGYALHRQLMKPDQILLLAFNNSAAKELQARVRQRLAPLGLDADRIVARTFHGFGLDVIGDATGKRPSVAQWVEEGREADQLMEIVDELKDRDPVFRAEWDLFRVVLGRDLPAFGKEEDSPEDWDQQDNTKTGFRTLQGEVVKSQGERLIADWLFYNGVEYQYEAAYPVDTADPRHRQYRPDFYYPTINVFHEHWAVDADGNPPDAFVNYAEGMRWKRQLHRDQNTALIETTMAQLWSGEAFKHLAQELTARGIVLDPNPDRPVQGRRIVDSGDLLKTVRTFLSHAKSNRLDAAALQDRLATEPSGRFHFRHALFLRLFDAIRQGWERRLIEAKAIDFEDMLNMAADHLEVGRWKSPFELVMVDEFQDASKARARLVQALVAQPGRCLFAVGDDWQSINRFAGADLSVMTQFQRWFGKAEVLRLERTFRCPQSLCDASGQFVLKHPGQLKKKVRSDATEHAPTLEVVEVGDEEEIATAIRRRLDGLYKNLKEGTIATNKDGILSVLVLGRYQKDKNFLPSLTGLADRLRINFMTVHGSKGLEADYVILPRMASGIRGFPSNILDDPVLRLAMPDGEDFEYAEERRLFYVALTRARRGVTLVAPRRRISPFVVELMKDQGLKAVSLTGEAASTQVCPKCQKGAMVQRPGKWGPFLACNRYPLCKNTVSLPKQR
ncbi:UvrD-helicase domain-containing protein [Variovorax sp. ZS18.2.2]|uniref:UvrD-helicase domain-containing protein n=1 Tax=Variovorax sp. ZS18.2.2 TaxID=2971255 RepID=UPI00215146C0|nr:UvrD-helicase domain-containing protein [Variovorax sp. ZS18.2.2]MCR6480853.1 UvrD-helicase domain-containing protein [Variovorax sp. ZS18.2.2]